MLLFGFLGQQQPQANGWPQQAQYFDAAQQNPAAQQAAAPYGGMAAAQQFQQYPGAAAPGQQAQAQAAPAQAAPAAAAGGAAPAINPMTGQPDYSAQWAEYYRSMGMHDQAIMIENQRKQNQAQTAATSQPAQFANYQAGGTAAASQASTVPTYAASQPQQYPYSQPY